MTDTAGLRRVIRANPLLLGLLLTLLSSFFGALIGVGSKFAGAYLSVHVIVFCQFTLGLLLSLPVMLRPVAAPVTLRTARFGLHLLRGLAGVISFYCFYLALQHISLVDASLLRNSAPLCVPLLALLLFRSVIPLRGWIPLLVGFAGVLCILRPSAGMTLWHLVGFGSGFLLAVSMVTTRMLVSTEPPGRVVFYYFAIALVATLPMALLNWRAAPWFVWLAIVGVGVAISLAMSFYTRAFIYAKPSVVSPVSYFGVVFAGLLGWILWDEVPDLWTCAGVLLVVVAAVLVMWLGQEEVASAT